MTHRRRHKRNHLCGVIALVLGAVLADVASGAEPNSEIRDLIQPVVLEAGKSDTLLISDLFYATDYDLRFKRHPDVTAEYRPATATLVLTPAQDFEGFGVMPFIYKDSEYAIPVYSRIKQEVTFRFTPEEEPRQRMNLMGTFNDWNRSSLPMHDEDGDGTYERTLQLEAGRYLYQFVIDEREIWDPNNPVKVDNGFGSYNSVVDVRSRHEERAYLHILDFESTDAAGVLSFRYEREQQPHALTTLDTYALLDNREMPDEWIELSENQIAVRVPLNQLHGDHVIRMIVSQEGHPTNLQTVRLRDGKPVAGNDFRTWHDAVIYALMIDRFRDGDSSNSRPVAHPQLSPKANYMGGDLQGIIDAIESGYFDTLGVNALWISPVNENTDRAYREWPPPHRYFSGYHGYWPIHHQRVEERFGDVQLLKKLVDTAHAHGIRVLLDFIANHVHEEHPFYREHRDWFGSYELPDGRMNIRLWDEHRLTTWFEPFMPSFDYQNSDAALQAMTDNAVWWLQQTGADGFRHDAVKHVPNRFWRLLTRKLKQHIEIPQQRPMYQIGETFGSYELISSYVNNGQLSGQFNFNLYDVANAVFLNPEMSFDVLAKELQKTHTVYGVDHLMGNLMDSHDKVRFMAYADSDLELNSSAALEMAWHAPPQVDHPSSYDKAKLYLTYLMTIPGVPVVYYGDEIGMTGAADPDNRRMMRFGDNLSAAEQEMLADVRRIIGLRRQHSALRRGDFQVILADTSVFAYLRSDVHERVLVVLNKGARARDVQVRLPEFYEVTCAVGLNTGEKVALSQSVLSLRIAPLSSRSFVVTK